MRRSIEQWRNCSPKAMAGMSEAAIRFAFEDAQADILVLHDLYEFAKKFEQDRGGKWTEFKEKLEAVGRPWP